jgi:alanyl-tRNA synthetase
MPTANEVRQQFIDFFVKKHGHTFVPSSSVVPLDDPTLLFTNAGMNQFKEVFLGTGTRPCKRAANSQKCIRAGGKHNDLDDVGKDTYHHTFFEMLGNWSFGDYFKKEAIAWAWELLTEVWKLDKARLHATVFEGDPSQGLAPDDEAFEYWKTQTDIDPTHIHYGSKKDNFWEMGETGPCGPCSEIHIDRTPDRSGGTLVNKGTADVIEIWNLVFIQFNRGADKKLTPLPAKHVDTGMGFERVTAVLQGKPSNYDTDVFTPIMDAVGRLAGKKYGGKLNDVDDVAFRVIADHLRMVTFAVTDGGQFSNKGRGSVMRSVLRRAVRFGYQRFELRDPCVYKLVPVLVEHMGNAYPELRKNPQRVAEIIKAEELSFLKTIERGIKLYADAAKRARVGSGVIAGKDVFDLHTTYGFPPDLTRQMAQEDELAIEEAEYRRLWDIHIAISGPEIDAETEQTLKLVLPIHGTLQPTDERPKWEGLETEATVLGWVETSDEKSRVVDSGTLEKDQAGWLILDRTSFYVEQGGQIGDRGIITTATGSFRVLKLQKVGDTVLHGGVVGEGAIDAGQLTRAQVDEARDFTRKNHTATHLLNWALRKVLGGEVHQKGSLVDPEKTRFDFSCDLPLTRAQIAEVESLVNERIYADLPVKPVFMSLAEAKKIPGVRAVFGEKYPDPVRVLLIGAERTEDVTPEHSVEFCGGTHLQHTGQAGFFKIVSQEAVSKGVRRVTAVTGREAVATVQKLAAVVDELTGRFRCQPEDLVARVQGLDEEIKKLQQQLKKGAAGDLQSAADKLLGGAVEVNGAKIVVGEMPAGPDEQMRQQLDRLRQKAGSAIIVLGWTEDGKVQLMAAVTDDLVKKGVKAGTLVGEAAKVVGGKGGGRPTMAQAGGKEPAKLAEALQVALKLAREQLGT